MQSGLNEGESQHLEVRVSTPWVIPKEKTTPFQGWLLLLSYISVGLKNARILFLRNFLEEKCFKLF